MTPFGRWLEGEGYGPRRLSAPKSNSNEAPMSAVKPVVPSQGRIAEQIPAFAAIGVIGYFVDAGITYPRRQISRPVARTRPAAGLHCRHDRQFPPQSVDHLPPLAGAALPRLPSLLRRRLRWACGQLFRLFGLRFARAPRRHRRHAGDPAAVRRRRERGGDGSDLPGLSVLRLSAVRVADCLAQSLRNRAMIASKRCGSSARCLFRLMTATSIAIRPIFSR